MRRLVICALLALVATASGIVTAAAPASDPVVGTWKLNVAKSTFPPGAALKSQTRTYSQSGPSITLVMKTVGADGKEVNTRATYQFDGKDHPVAGTPDYDSLSAKQVDSNTATFTLKKGGKAFGTTDRTVSKDGKTLTSQMTTTSANGEQSESVLVFDKQ